MPRKPMYRIKSRSNSPSNSVPPLLCVECGSEPPPRVVKGAPRRRKACFGCAVCEDVVVEPSILSDVYNSQGFKPAFATLLGVGACTMIEIVAASGGGSVEDPPTQLLSLSLLLTVTSLSLKLFFTIFCFLIPVLLFNAATAISKFKSKPPEKSITDAIEKGKDKYSKLLSEAIKLKTISYDGISSDDTTDYGELLKMRTLLKSSFPLTASKLHWSYVNEYSIVIKWQGSDKKLKPIMICAHLDVVPAPNEKDNEWTEDPWSGKIKDGEVWGRGAIDNKHNVIGQMGAIEELLESGFKPTRTIYLAFGHDEEISGHQGAKYIADHMKKEVGEKGLEAVFDEGPMMIEGALPGMKGHVALVANSEKGYLTLEMSVKANGGHSSMPPFEQGTIAIIADAVSKLDSSPVPAHFSKGAGVHAQLEMLCALFGGPMRLLTANLWIFSGLMKKILLKASPAAAAMLRTTTAITVIKGGTKANVLPYDVKFYVNHRVHPEDTVESVIEYDRKVINDNRVTIKPVEGITPASPISSLKSDAWRWIEESVAEVFNNPSAPSVMVGNTDTRWYWDLTEDIYRFSPVELNIKDVKMFHGLNERLSVEGMSGIVQYYKVLVEKACVK
ncbi:hypothetical protein TL16_g06757 [Triparma laevis f. inornata]|uniref:Peptidase M20 dimerisation domain-containing protein n=2 Tax=Triparma laevis TaxID=1534972 RepID=A0A9W7CLG1_9STRA|nr:hypothetical protein TL16_g06757 [Triparma laevis f. inornata]GMI06779.1 hypothetical protein TrLO_g8059 [Triparma laevis f. longispina]